MLSPFEWWCRNFILPDICKPCLFVFLRNLFYLTALLRRASVLAEGQNLGAGGIHFRRACEVLTVSIKITTPKGVVIFMAGGDNLEPRMRKPCAATISIFRVLSLHMFLQLFVLALNRFEAICQGRIDIGLTSQYHLQIVLCPLELILILLSSLFVCRNTFPVGWHPHQPK